MYVCMCTYTAYNRRIALPMSIHRSEEVDDGRHILYRDTSIYLTRTQYKHTDIFS